MKKMIKIFAVAAIAALACVSCKIEVEPSVLPAEEGIQIAVVADMPVTKTELSGASDVVWTNGVDKVGFFNHTADVNVQSSAAVVDGSGKASFTATVPSAGTYYAYYPYQNFTGENAPNTDGVVMEIPNVQKPTPTSFDPDADLLLSTAFEATGATTPDPATIQFKRLGAFIRVQFIDGTAGTKLSGEYATSVSIQGDERLSAKFRVHGVNGAEYQSGWKKITASYAADTYALTGSGQYAFFGVRPQTFANGSKIIITANTGAYAISKTITMPKDVVLGPGDILPIKVTLNDVNVGKKIALHKVVGIYGVAGVAGWPAYVPSGSMASVLDDNSQLRNATFDKDYIYVAQSESWAANDDVQPYIFKFKISDGTCDGHVTPATDPAYMAGSYCGVHPVSCVRFMDNTNPSINSGKPVLVAVNLGDGGTHRVYAWENGIGNQPRLISNFSNSRRWGDKVSVEGNYVNGKLWWRSNDEAGVVGYSNFVDGYTSGQGGSHVWNWIEGLGSIPVDDVNNISEYYSFGSGGAYGLIATNTAVGLHLVEGTSQVKLYPKYARSFGWHAFTYGGDDYLAFLDASDGLNKPRITVLKGATDSVAHLRETIDNEVVVARVSIASADPADFNVTTTYAHQNLGDCQVRVLDDGVYILGMIRGGVALFKVVDL